MSISATRRALIDATAHNYPRGSSAENRQIARINELKAKLASEQAHASWHRRWVAQGRPMFWSVWR